MSASDVHKEINQPLLRELYKIRFLTADIDDFGEKLSSSGNFTGDQIDYLLTKYHQIVTVDDVRARYTIELAGLYLELKQQKDLMSQLSGFVNKLSKDLVDMKGSSSLKDKIESQAVDNIAPKKARVTKRKRSIKKQSSGTAKTKNNRKSTKKVTTPLQIIQEVNKALPATVAKNMGSPRLNYRTGRFANSVRLIDIKRTNKGFYSIGYTYQRDPYQVFERGLGKAPWNIPDRDPRDLIDMSVREIARPLALGRIFTRRL